MRRVGLGVALLLGAITWLAPPMGGLEASGQRFLAVLVFCLVCWITTPFPVELTAVLLVVLPWVLRLVSVGEAFSGWTSETTWLMFGALQVGRVWTATGLDRRVAYALLSRLGRLGSSFWGVLGAEWLVAYFMSFAVPSSTVVTSLLCAIVYPLVGCFHPDPRSRVGKTLMLFVPLIALINGRQLVTGGAYNMVVWGVLREAGIEISWIGWFLSQAPACLIAGALLYLFMRATVRPEVGWVKEGPCYFAEEYRRLGPLTPQEHKAAILVGAAVVLWLTGFLTGLSPAVVAMAVAIVSFLPRVGVMGFAEAVNGGNWGLMWFVVAIMSLPRMASATGLDAVLTAACQELAALASSPLAFLGLVWFLTSLGFWLGLNIATPALFLPYLLEPASQWGISLTSLGFFATLVQPAVLFYQVPQPLVAYHYGTFTQRDYVRYGAVLWLLCTLVALAMYYTWWPLAQRLRLA